MKMKKMLSVGIVLSVLSTSVLNVYASDVDNIYLNYGYDNYQDLKNDYLLAIEENDINKQAELEKIAKVTLEEEIRISKDQNKSMKAEPGADELFYTYFSGGGWAHRNTGWSLGMVPKRNDNKNAAWNGVYAKFYRTSQWDNSDSMEKQFYCHARNFWPYTTEEEWNLEPWRTSTNYFTCN